MKIGCSESRDKVKIGCSESRGKVKIGCSESRAVVYYSICDDFPLDFNDLCLTRIMTK